MSFHVWGGLGGYDLYGGKQAGLCSDDVGRFPFCGGGGPRTPGVSHNKKDTKITPGRIDYPQLNNHNKQQNQPAPQTPHRKGTVHIAGAEPS